MRLGIRMSYVGLGKPKGPRGPQLQRGRGSNPRDFLKFGLWVFLEFLRLKLLSLGPGVGPHFLFLGGLGEFPYRIPLKPKRVQGVLLPSPAPWAQGHHDHGLLASLHEPFHRLAWRSDR